MKNSSNYIKLLEKKYKREMDSIKTTSDLSKYIRDGRLNIGSAYAQFVGRLIWKEQMSNDQVKVIVECTNKFNGITTFQEYWINQQ